MNCAVCRQPIRKRYIEPPGTKLSICLACWSRVPHCSRCHRLAKHLSPVENHKLCPECLETIDRCASCQGLLLKSYYSRRGSDEKFCSRCVHTGPVCAACHAPVRANDRVLGDGRRVCAACQATAIEDVVQAEALYEQVQAICRETLHLPLSRTVPLQVVDAATLSQIHSKKYRPDNRFAHRALGTYYEDGEGCRIYLEGGLPRILSLRTLAHEYGHAYVRQFDDTFDHAVANEGFAEWVAYGVLRHLGLDALTKEMEQREDYYGVGLKWMLNLERSKGPGAVFALMKISAPAGNPSV
jgi:hypothetical protein